MNADLNSRIQRKLNKNKKRKNMKRLLLVLSLVAVIVTSTVLANPATALSEEASGDVVQGMESSGDAGAQDAGQADVQPAAVQAVAAAPAVESVSAETPAAPEEQTADSTSTVKTPDAPQSAETGTTAGNSADGKAAGQADETAAATEGAADGTADGAGKGAADGTADGAGKGTTDGTAEEAAGKETSAAETELAETESEEASSVNQIAFEDDRVKVTASFADGGTFAEGTALAGENLGSDDWNSMLSTVKSRIAEGNSSQTSEKTGSSTGSSNSDAAASAGAGAAAGVGAGTVAANEDNKTSKITTTTTIEYSVAGLHALSLRAKNVDGSDTAAGGLSFSAEFKSGLNDAGYASKEEKTESESAGSKEDGSHVLTTTTTRYETSWRAYLVSGGNFADAGSITDITDAEGTGLSADSAGTLQSASFRGSLPQTVAFAQIVKKTVTVTTEERTADNAAEEVPMPAATFEQKVTTENGTVTVHVDAEEGTFEEGTAMTVTPVTSRDILDKAIDAAGGKGAAAAMDITFTNPDGTKTEPLKPIRVKMTSAVLNRADEAHVVHVDDSGSTDVVAKKSDGRTVESTSSDAPAADAKNVVSFESDSFSVYAIVYTVDFTFSGYTFSIKGGSSIRLSSLAQKLGLRDTKQGKDFDIADVDDVTFSDNSLVTVTKKDGDWKLVSKKPFTTTEKLTIRMKDGSKYEVEVKDAQDTDLTQFLTSAVLTVDGKEVEGESWKVKPGQSYDIKLQFEEKKDGLQFDNNNELVYSLPEGVNVEDKDGTFDITIGQKVISGNTFHVDKKTRQVRVKFNTSNTYFNDLTQSEDLKFYVKFSAQFDENVNTIKFNDTVSRNVIIDTSHHVTVQKSGDFNWDDKKMHYKVTVHSDGRSENVVVTDTLTGTAVTLDQASIKCTSDKSSNKAFTVNEKTDKGFKLTIPEMENNETVTFTYTASIDFSKVGSGSTITADKTSNGVTVSSKDDPNPESAEYNHEIYYTTSTITKEQTSISDIETDGDQKYRDIEWKINANSNKNVAFSYIQDSIKPFDDGKYYMEYSGDGLSVVVTKEDGTTENRTIKWSDTSITKTVTEGKFVGWKYTPPAGDGKASYLVTYSTKAEVQENKTVTYKNEVKDDYNQQFAEVKILPSDDSIAVTKQATEVNEKSITWKISVSVPAKGYDKFYVKDTLPNKWINSEQYFDKVSSISVDGLINGESFISEEEKNEKGETSAVKLIFYKDAEKKTEGLQATVSNRTLNITVVTNNNQEWASNSTDPDHHAHTNTAEAGNGVISSTASDTASVYSKSISKTGKELTDNGTHLIKYTVTITGLHSDSFVIDDTFDKSILSYDQSVSLDGANKLYGGNQYYQGDGETAVKIESTDTGIRITGNNVPKQKSGAYYSHYKIVYYLKVNDAKLNQKAIDSEGHKAVIANTASWDGISANSNIDYTYHPLEKTQGQYNADKSHPNTIPYTITVNKGKVKMNDGNAMTLTDTSTNLYIDPKDISVTTDPAEKKSEVKYDIADSNTLKFTIPDETAVTITYYGYVLGETGKQIEVSNTASLLGENVTKDSTCTKVASAGGTGTVCKVYIRKYETGDYNHQLAGAEFKLLDSDEKPIRYGDVSSKKGQDVKFTTNSNGSAEVYLSSETDGVSLQFDTQYYLQEIKAPDGYECSDQLIPFKISKTENNPQNHIYLGSSNINISNPKIVKVKITLHKQKEGDPKVNLAGAVFSLYQAAADGTYSQSDDLLLAQKLTTDPDDGTVVLQGKNNTQELVSGTYYLVETSAPTGYEVLPSPVKLVVSNGKVTVGSTEYNYNTDSSGTNTCTINIEDTPKKQFVFYKRWEKTDQVIAWPNDVNQINVTLHGTFSSTDSTVNGKTKDYSLTLSPTGAQEVTSEGNVSWKVEKSNNSYKYTVTNLPATIYTDEQGVNHVGTWTYSVTETKLDDYDTFYGKNVAGAESGTAQISIDNTKKSAEDGEYIINKPIDRYALPSTGGPGDLPWVAPGMLLMLLAGAVFAVRKLLIYRSKGKGGGLRS